MSTEAIAYTLIRSQRKTLAIQVQPTGQVVVRAPQRLSKAQIEAFVRQREPRIRQHVARAREQAAARDAAVPFTQAELREMARRACRLLPPRVARFAALAGVTYGRITIRSQRTRWGSCSTKGNLNFNCLLALCPDAAVDYVAAHEVCHRKEMNHSPRFWAELERILPTWREGYQWLKTDGQALIRRLGAG